MHYLLLHFSCTICNFITFIANKKSSLTQSYFLQFRTKNRESISCILYRRLNLQSPFRHIFYMGVFYSGWLHPLTHTPSPLFFQDSLLVSCSLMHFSILETFSSDPPSFFSSVPNHLRTKPL